MFGIQGNFFRFVQSRFCVLFSWLLLLVFLLLYCCKPEKNYPMRTIVTTVGTAPYGTSKYLAEITQPTLSKTKQRVINSSSFANEAATWETTQEEFQVSYDVIILYPSIPIDKAILIGTLNSN